MIAFAAMRVAVFSARPTDRRFLDAANGRHGHELVYLEAGLAAATAPLARGFPAVCAFVNDRLDAATLKELAAGGTRLVALRSAGFNHVDLAAADSLGLTVARVPAYSPYSIAEHTIGLMLALNRKLHRAHARVREQNFSLEGLLGFDFHGRTAGVVGTGNIGLGVIRILRGFGCRVLASDPRRDPEVERLGARYVSLEELLAESDIITLHCPLTPATHHLIDAKALARTKRGVMLVNTSRGGVVDTAAVIEALKSGHLGHLGLDVYEEEGDIFFRDLSSEVLKDDVFARLLTFPNVIVTAHQGFFTSDAVAAIAETTLGNVTSFERTGTVDPANRVGKERVRS